MSVYQVIDLHALPDFPKRQDQLAIVEREPLDGSDAFFQKLMHTPLRVIGRVSKVNSIDDILRTLEDTIPEELQADTFYPRWISDMAQICEVFCNTLNGEAVGFCLSTERGCRRYHIDNVPMRLLVTYTGQGTEWIPDEAANRTALASGAPNEEIITNPSAREFMSTWDIAIFRGGPKGLLHRTPDSALNGASILMRLDHASFWDSIMKKQQEKALRQPVNT